MVTQRVPDVAKNVANYLSIVDPSHPCESLLTRNIPELKANTSLTAWQIYQGG